MATVVISVITAVVVDQVLYFLDKRRQAKNS